MSKTQKLSIRLLKEGVSLDESLKCVDESLKHAEESLNDERQLKKYKKIQGASYLTNQSDEYEPNWSEYLALNVSASTASAILFIPVSDRFFALCFNYGHTLLNESKFVDDFGLRTALNMLDKNKIKSSDIFAPSDNSKQRKTQTTRDSNLQGHDLDGYVHILKNITGKSKHQYKDFSKSISASLQSIKITVDESVEKLPDVCKKLLDIYNLGDYKRDFPEVFYIKPIKEITTIQELNDKLVEYLLDKKNNDIYLEVPELIDFEDIEQFQINIKDRNRDKSKYYLLPTIEDFRTTISTDLKVPLTYKNLITFNLDLIDQGGNTKKSHPLIKCLVLDINLNGEQYHFSHGEWYCIDSSFERKVNKKLKDSYKNDIDGKEILTFSHRNEKIYNTALSKKLGAFLLDERNIPMSGNNKIELCDILYTSSNEFNIFIHVKIKHNGSAELSHLFEQGDVSLALLNSKDKVFIAGMKKLLKSKGTTLDENKKSVVHFLVISNTNKNKNYLKKIPLFAKIALFKKIDQIKSKGAEVYWSVINKS